MKLLLLIYIYFPLSTVLAQDSLFQFPIKGSNIFIEASDSVINHFHRTAIKQFESWGYWNIVADQQEANYILELEVILKGASVISWGKVKIRGILKSIEGVHLWTSKDITGESKWTQWLQSKKRAVRNLIKKEIEPKL